MKLMFYGTAIFATSGIPLLIEPIPLEIGLWSVIGGAAVAIILFAIEGTKTVVELVKAVAEVFKH